MKHVQQVQVRNMPVKTAKSEDGLRVRPLQEVPYASEEIKGTTPIFSHLFSGTATIGSLICN
jgi:hypothetical protein